MSSFPSMAEQTMDEAMVVIQEASAVISQLNKNLQTNNTEVATALKELTNKVAQLEESRVTAPPPVNKPPLYIRVSFFFVQLSAVYVLLTEFGAGCI